jgi:hypothetical protein
MQGKNSTRSMQPKSGDGTQDVKRTQDANWFGQSQEPQEEFSSDHLGEGGYHGNDTALKPEEPKKSDARKPVGKH